MGNLLCIKWVDDRLLNRNVIEGKKIDNYYCQLNFFLSNLKSFNNCIISIKMKQN